MENEISGEAQSGPHLLFCVFSPFDLLAISSNFSDQGLPLTLA
jgi:hypothetical protein